MKTEPEEWRPVVGFEGIYAVSNFGHVRREAVLSTQKDRLGYVFVQLWRKRKRVRRPVHQLVAEAFLGPPGPGQITDHLDSDTGNNHRRNLQWVSRGENIRRAYLRGRVRHRPDCRCFVCRRRPHAP